MAARTALLVLDVQKAFDDATYWGRRNNPDCERNVADLIESWRDRAQPVVFVRHDSDEEVSPLRPDEAGNAFKDVIEGEPDLLVSKRVNWAFHGDPDLGDWLTDKGIEGILVRGIQTNMCCETTARVQRAAKRRERLSGAYLAAFNRALHWAEIGRIGAKR